MVFFGVIDFCVNVDSLTEKIISLSLQEEGERGYSYFDERKITKNEKTIMTLFSSGLDAKRIALEEGKSIKTIYSHRRNALMKLGFRTINEYIIYKNWLTKCRWRS